MHTNFLIMILIGLFLWKNVQSYEYMYNWEKFLKSKTWVNKNDILLLANVFDKLFKNVS